MSEINGPIIYPTHGRIPKNRPEPEPLEARLARKDPAKIIAEIPSPALREQRFISGLLNAISQNAKETAASRRPEQPASHRKPEAAHLPTTAGEMLRFEITDRSKRVLGRVAAFGSGLKHRLVQAATGHNPAEKEVGLEGLGLIGPEEQSPEIPEAHHFTDSFQPDEVAKMRDQVAETFRPPEPPPEPNHEPERDAHGQFIPSNK